MAAGLVIVSHSSHLGLLPPVLGCGLGQIGVIIVFTLSGLVKAFLYLDRTPDRGEVTGYAAARIGRVAPLYLTIAIASLDITASLDGNFRYAFGLHDPSTFVQAVLVIRAPNEL